LFEQIRDEANFEVFPLMNGDASTKLAIWRGIDVMTSADPEQNPTTLLKRTAELFAGYGFQTAISITETPSGVVKSSTSR
jgi:hypothetical protein